MKSLGVYRATRDVEFMDSRSVVRFAGDHTNVGMCAGWVGAYETEVGVGHAWHHAVTGRIVVVFPTFVARWVRTGNDRLLVLFETVGDGLVWWLECDVVNHLDVRNEMFATVYGETL